MNRQRKISKKFWRDSYRGMRLVQWFYLAKPFEYRVDFTKSVVQNVKWSSMLCDEETETMGPWVMKVNCDLEQGHEGDHIAHLEDGFNQGWDLIWHKGYKREVRL